MMQPIITARRADIGLERQRFTKNARRVQPPLFEGRIIGMRHRPKDNPIRFHGSGNDRLGDGCAVLFNWQSQPDDGSDQ